MIVTVLHLLSSILSREFFWSAPISFFLLVISLLSAGFVVKGCFSGSLMFVLVFHCWAQIQLLFLEELNLEVGV